MEIKCYHKDTKNSKGHHFFKTSETQPMTDYFAVKLLSLVDKLE